MASYALGHLIHVLVYKVTTIPYKLLMHEAPFLP